MSVRVPTAAEVAALLVAACARLGVPPTEVFVEGARGAAKARVLAAAAAVAGLGLRATDAARIFRLASRLYVSPTRLKLWRITAADIEAVARAGGLSSDIGRGGRADGPGRFPPGDAAPPATAPVPVRRVGPGWVRSGPRGPGPREAAPQSRPVRLRPLTARRADYAARFLGAGWSAEDTAWLFDTDPEALLDALEHGVLESRASA